MRLNLLPILTMGFGLDYLTYNVRLYRILVMIWCIRISLRRRFVYLQKHLLLSRLLMQFTGILQYPLFKITHSGPCREGGWVNLNSDASLFVSTNGVRLGSVVRNSHGTMFYAHVIFQPICDSIEIAEALTVAKGLSLVKQVFCQKRNAYRYIAKPISP